MLKAARTWTQHLTVVLRSRHPERHSA